MKTIRFRHHIALAGLAAAAVLSSAFQCSQVVRTSLQPSARADVAYLASDSLRGRGTGSEGEKAAAAYLVSRFTDLGLVPKGENGGWYQPFTFKPMSAPQVHHAGDSARLGMGLVKELTGTNVLALLDNGAATTVVIGAHYDHLGMGDENSLWTGGAAIHNGADDNASGVAGMLELARRLSQPGAPRANNYLFIGFSAEEKGLIGSKYFCDHPTVDLSAVNYMLNMDMVGRYNEANGLAIYGTGTSPAWVPVLDKLKIKQVRTESGTGPSDHTSFYLKNIPVLHFFTGQHEDYHKPSDDSEKINYEGIETVLGVVEKVIQAMDKQDRLSFTKTVDSTPSASDFKVTLGVMPDYMYNNGDGMRIDGTKEGRPAARAGLLQGDVITAIGAFPVTDVYSYMECLGKFSKGESTTVTLKRNGEELVLPVKWE